MAVDTDQLKDVIARAEAHQAKLVLALAKLERRIVDYLATAPLKDGILFDLEWAIQARSELRKLIEEEYLTTIDGFVREYKAVAGEVSAMLATYGDFAKLDPSVVAQLQNLSFRGFENLGQEYLDIIAKQVYESTLTGQTFAVGVASIQQAVSGDMARYASQQLHDSLLQFDRSINTRIALDSGATKFTYRGPDDSATREFCARHVNKTYTIDEIEEIWQGSWGGKIDSNAFVSAGGYNCRHRWRPVIED